MRAGGREGDAVVLVVSTARMTRRRNLAVLRGNWGNCVTTFLVVSTARMAGTRNLAVFLKKRAEQRMQVEEEVRKKLRNSKKFP